MNTDKRKRFIQRAESRVSKALKQLKLIGNLSNAEYYEYTSEDYEKINEALLKAVDDIWIRFENKGADSEKDVFKLE